MQSEYMLNGNSAWSEDAYKRIRLV